jgi:hypothetical protein
VEVKQAFSQDLRDFPSKRTEALDSITRLHLFEELDDGPEVFDQVPQQIEGGVGTQPPETLGNALQFIDRRVDGVRNDRSPSPRDQCV